MGVLNQTQIRKIFGKPGTNQVTGWMPIIGRVTCHKKIAPQLSQAMTEIERKGLKHLVQSFEGCYNFRKMRGKNVLSHHSWGIAVDINANLVGGFPSKRPQPKELVDIFKKWGFYNLKRDAMHFEWVRFVGGGEEDMNQQETEALIDKKLESLFKQTEGHHADIQALYKDSENKDGYIDRLKAKLRDLEALKDPSKIRASLGRIQLRVGKLESDSHRHKISWPFRKKK